LNNFKANQLAFFFYLVLLGTFVKAQQQKYVFVEQKMGAPFQLQMYCADSTKAGQMAKTCFVMADSLNKIFSDYDPNSEISILTNTYKVGQWYTVSAALWQLLQISAQAHKQSHGAFDISIGRLTKLWRYTKAKKKLPELKTIRQAKKKTGMQYVKLKNQQILFKKEGIQFDFGGIAKGYLADVCLRFLTQNNVACCLVNAAGNMAIGQAPKNTAGWAVGIEGYGHAKLLWLQNCGVSTSGAAYQYVDILGKRYSHILDPATGLGLQHSRQVSILAGNATTADWLSTAASVMSIKKAKKLIEKTGSQGLVLSNNNNAVILLKIGADF
jgi:FAD:protein FMN transferase